MRKKGEPQKKERKENKHESNEVISGKLQLGLIQSIQVINENWQRNQASGMHALHYLYIKVCTIIWRKQKAYPHPLYQRTSRSSLIFAPFTPMMEPARLWWISSRSSHSKSTPL